MSTLLLYYLPPSGVLQVNADRRAVRQVAKATLLGADFRTDVRLFDAGSANVDVEVPWEWRKYKIKLV